MCKYAAVAMIVERTSRAGAGVLMRISLIEEKDGT
jgi:hypothetical protein